VPTVRANGIDFHVSRFRSGAPGDRPVVICVHGLGVVDQASMSMTLGLPLAKHFDVVLYDLRGHGRSQFVTSGFTVAQHVEDFWALTEALEIDKPVHVLGGSYGGAVGFQLALDHPDRVASLSLVDPLLQLPDWGQTLAWSLEYYLDRMNKSSNGVEELMELFQTTARRRATALADRGRRILEGTSIIEEVRSEEQFSMAQFNSIKVPVLAAIGLDSLLLPLVAVLPELVPTIEIIGVEGANHITVFKAPEVRDGIAQFIHRLEPISAAPPAPRTVTT
jgi:pimeloyl-ACP methyl ester carboxylesterase